MSSRVYLFFPPRGHKSPPTLCDRLNPPLCLQRLRFPVPRYAKRLDVALYAIGPLVFLPAPSFPLCTLTFPGDDLLWQPPATRSDERPRPQTSSRTQSCPNASTSSYLEGTLVRGQTLGRRSVRNRSTIFRSCPVLFALHPHVFWA